MEISVPKPGIFSAFCSPFLDWLKTHDDHLWHHTDLTNLLLCMTTTICFSQLGSNDELVAMQKRVTIFGSALLCCQFNSDSIMVLICIVLHITW